jgi:preprotein translocase subunit Sss1
MKIDLAYSISQLLYRYDCVIIPGFGGFVTQFKSAAIDRQAHSIYPPSKEVSFNSMLVKNDGVLVNFVAEDQDLSYNSAQNLIDIQVEDWKKQLRFQDLYLAKIGRFHLGLEQQILFEPENSTNFLTDSFGLSAVIAKEIEAQVKKPLIQRVPKAKTKVVSSRTNYLKYAAVFAIGLSVIGLVGAEQIYSKYRQARTEQVRVEDQYKQERIETATFAIDRNLPTILVPVKKLSSSDKAEKIELVEAVEITKTYFVIAGAFRDQNNAKKKVSQLRKSGFEDASELGANKWNLYQVSFGGFQDRLEAEKLLKQVRLSGAPDAWVLEQK